jgi:hypothetical protein
MATEFSRSKKKIVGRVARFGFAQVPRILFAGPALDDMDISIDTDFRL